MARNDVELARNDVGELARNDGGELARKYAFEALLQNPNNTRRHSCAGRNLLDSAHVSKDSLSGQGMTESWQGMTESWQGMTERGVNE